MAVYEERSFTDSNTQQQIQYVLYRKHIKNIILRVDPSGTIMVSAPIFSPLYKIQKFISEKIEFINRARSRLESKKVIRTGKFDSKMKEKCTAVFMPLIDSVYEKFNAEGIKVPYPVLKIRKMKSRWGSCIPSKKQITLNMNLIYFDEDCIRQVIVHEFCHFIYLNHSKDFYALMERFESNYKVYRKRLESVILI
jgi:predicted metal-dependent hydrolase